MEGIEQDPFYNANVFQSWNQSVIPYWDGTRLQPSVFRLEPGMYRISPNLPVDNGDQQFHSLLVDGAAGIKVSTTNTGTGTSDWIAANFGNQGTGPRLVMGNYNGSAVIAGVANDLVTPDTLAIQPVGGRIIVGQNGSPFSSIIVGTASTVAVASIPVGGRINQSYTLTGAAIRNTAIASPAVSLNAFLVISNVVIKQADHVEVTYTNIGTAAATLSGGITINLAVFNN
jgi:hypothetical protein